MAQRRSKQRLSRSFEIRLPDDESLVSLTVSADRRELHAFEGGQGPLILAWAIAGALAAAAQPGAKPRARDGQISLRLERLGDQLQLTHEFVGPRDVMEQARRLGVALTDGCSPDPEVQRRSLNYFVSDVLARGQSSVRIVFKVNDVGRLNGIAVSPLQCVLQIFLITASMVKLAGNQPRGRAARLHHLPRLIQFLACLADELMSRSPELFSAIQHLAHSEAAYGVDPASVTRLECIYFVVARALQTAWNYELEEIQQFPSDFARTYLYPYKEAYRTTVARCLEIPRAPQRLLALGDV
jgi:hypothetical protein